MIQKTAVMRKCISCKTTFDRESLLKITNDPKLGIMLNQGMGRSAYICKTEQCFKDPKLQKKLQKALKSVLSPEFLDIFEGELANYK